MDATVSIFSASQKIQDVNFNQTNPVTEARVGWWIDTKLGMIIFYYGDGDSQIFGAELNTDRKIKNKLNKLFETKTIK